MLAAKPFGRGRVVLSATAAGPQWSNLPATGLFLPMVVRMSMQSRRRGMGDNSYPPGAKVQIRPALAPSADDGAEPLPPGAAVSVTPPARVAGAEVSIPVPLVRTDSGYIAEFGQTDLVGSYRWQLVGDQEVAGAFVVNGDGAESDLAAMTTEEFTQAMASLGAEKVHVAGSLAAVRQAAAAAAEGRNWWDLLLVAVILLLVIEAIIANGPGRREALPAGIESSVSP